MGNPKTWKPESGIRNQKPESRIRNPESGIQNLESGIQNLESGIRNSEFGIRNPESGIRNPESRIHKNKRNQVLQLRKNDLAELLPVENKSSNTRTFRDAFDNEYYCTSQ